MFRQWTFFDFFFPIFCQMNRIRNKRYKVCGVTNKLPNAKKNKKNTQCSTFKVATCELKKNPKIFRERTQKLSIVQKKNPRNKTLFKFYLYVTNFKALGIIIIIYFQNRFGPLSVLTHKERSEASEEMLNVLCYSYADSLYLSHRKRSEVSETKRIAH